MVDERERGYLDDPAICRDPIFIIGAPRSGTTILARSLGEHGALWCSSESDFLFQLFGSGRAEQAFDKARNIRARGWLRTEQVERDEFLAALGLGVNALFTSRSGGKRWIDHTPVYTLMVDVLAEMFPGASFLHMLRDGRRVVHSMVNFLKSLTVTSQNLGPDFIGSWTTDFRQACRTWRKYVEISTGFCRRNPSRAITVVNEQLVIDPNQGFDKVFEFLGLTPEQEPVRFFGSNRVNSSFGPDSRDPDVARRLSEPWLAWTAEQRSIFREEAGSTLVECGFVDDGDLWMVAEPETYEELVAQVRQVVESVVPPAATVIVVSKGDDGLLELGPRRAWHFPQVEDGAYAGFYPTDGYEAIDGLEGLRARGGQFLLIPSTAYWWLRDYEGFRDHLDRCYARVWNDDRCLIYALTGPGEGS